MRLANVPILLGLAFLLPLAAGCASTVLGPGTGESNADLGLFHVLLNTQPGDLGFGPPSGLSRSAQDTLARSIDVVVDRVDLTDVVRRTVYIPGFSGPRLPEVPRRADAAYLTARLAERVVEVGGRVAFDRSETDFVLIPWLQISGGITTHREYRSYGYPLYLHEEDQRPAWLMVFLYDRAKRRLGVIEGDRTWQVRFESYILGIIPYEWFLGF